MPVRARERRGPGRSWGPRRALASLIADARGSLRSRGAGLAPNAIPLGTRNPGIAWWAGGTRRAGHAGAKEAASPRVAPLAFLSSVPSVPLLALHLSSQAEEVRRELPCWSRGAHFSFVTLWSRRSLEPWQSWGPGAARLNKRVGVIDGRPGGAWGSWGPWGAGHSPHAKSEADVPRLPLLSFQSIHPGAARPPREADLALVPRTSVRARGSSEARLALGSFLGRGQGSAVGADDAARFPLLTLGSREALLAFGAQVAFRPSRSREACKAWAALRSRPAHHCSILLRHVDHRPRGPRGPGQAGLPHSVLPWVSFFSLAPLFSFGSRGPSNALSPRKAWEAGGSVSANFSLGSRCPSRSRVPLESWGSGWSLQPFDASGRRPEGSPRAFHVLKSSSKSWSWWPGGARGSGGSLGSSWPRGSCYATLAGETHGARVPLASLGSWGTHVTGAAFLSRRSWLPVFSWGAWRALGAGNAGGPIPSRHSGETGRPWRMRAVQAEAARLTRQAWDTWGAGGPGEATRASEGLWVAPEAGPLHVDEGQLVMSEGGSWWPRRPLGPWGSSWPDPRVPLLTLGAHISWGPREALGPSFTGFSIFTRVARLTVPSWGTILPWRTWRPRWPLCPRNWLHLQALNCRARRTLRPGWARQASGSRLPLLPLLASLCQGAPGALDILISRGSHI